MSLNRDELVPASVLGLRKLDFIPGHFSTILVNQYQDVRKIEEWIEYHLNSRYAIQKTLDLNADNKVEIFIQIGLEDPSELLLLNLGCQHIYNKG